MALRDGERAAAERAREALASLFGSGPVAISNIASAKYYGRVLADVTTLASELAVNIVDLEIAHSSEGQQGVLILVVEAGMSERFRGGLLARGYRPSVQRLD